MIRFDSFIILRLQSIESNRRRETDDARTMYTSAKFACAIYLFRRSVFLDLPIDILLPLATSFADRFQRGDHKR